MSDVLIWRAPGSSRLAVLALAFGNVASVAVTASYVFVSQ